MPSAPALPPFDDLRLATLEDLPRIATVAAAGFFHSPTFRYQRVYHAEYPDDTLASYWAEYRSSILNPACAVLVAEDTFAEDEGRHVYEALRGATTYCPATASPVRGHSVVVGIASIAIAGSRCVGQFQTNSMLVRSAGPSDSLASLVAPEVLNRDVCRDAASTYNEATAPAKASYLDGLMRLSTLAVHPAYWRRGHAAKLVSWCTQLADLEGVSVGISAVPTGAIIAANAGFEQKEIVRVMPRALKGEAAQRNGPKVELWVAVRSPKSTFESSDESTTSLDSQESQQ
ncbi:hypothetical protein P280DRAFT_459722 [Massarina eburnea CBS 473.64]|uniref:N-acetyltransferase domain-containing protein n=1 Tax=Massarina eburnea CBS 473.64 TaxID=1395130 RepID=A0A6A6RP63_9PLEO|nr:hypothetical protein P280DRAFT_459722 [Massarina eburnea CBS 473.64]